MRTNQGDSRPRTGRRRVPVALAAGTPHTVSFDGYSFLIDGQRTYIWSGEFHYFRLPSPDLWLDIFQKMKAAGFNAASIYFDWGYHSPAPGVYDFTGVRNVDKLLDMAQKAGIYVIARPAPYINAEVDGGGLPGWMSAKPGANRSNDPQFLKYSDEWMTQIDRILARHHRAADRQQQRHFQLRRRHARYRRPGLVPAGLQLLQPNKVERCPGHQLRPPRGTAAVHAGVSGWRVRPVGRARLRQVRAADQRPVRQRVLQAEHRRRGDRAELLHDLRRDELGLARHSGELHLL